MHPTPADLFQAHHRPRPASPAPPRLLLAGATGALGNEMLRRLAGSLRFEAVQVLAREPITPLMRSVRMQQVPEDADIASWPAGQVDVGVVLFDPPRLFYDRERALWTPAPEQLPALAQWLRRSGAHTLAVVLPHDQGRLPAALRHGLANLDEQQVAGMGFERLVFVRAARKPGALPQGTPRLVRLAHWMLAITRFMVPPGEQPVRASKLAELVDLALRSAPDGIHVAGPEVVWEAAQGDLPAVTRRWLGLAAG